MEKLSFYLYDWILEKGGAFHQVYENNGGRGMFWAFVFLLAVSIIAAAIFYFGVSKTIEKANKKNYWTVFLLGMLTLVIVTVVGLRLITGYAKPDFWSMNLLKLNLINIAYYLVLFEVWSLVFMPMSKATVHMFSK